MLPILVWQAEPAEKKDATKDAAVQRLREKKVAMLEAVKVGTFYTEDKLDLLKYRLETFTHFFRKKGESADYPDLTMEDWELRRKFAAL